MDKLINSYPVFVPDQVLTNKSLNNAFGFLNQQARNTRSGMTGHGIICGLNYAVTNGNGSIIINSGYGSSVDGLLIQLADDNGGNVITYPFAKRYTLPPDIVSDLHLDYPDAEEKKAAVKNPALATTANALIRKALETKGSRAAEAMAEIWKSAFELVPKIEEGNKEEIVKIPELLNKSEDWVLFLYLEITDVKSENCSPEDCDERGKIRRLRVVPLIAPKKLFTPQSYAGAQQPVVHFNRMIDYESQVSSTLLYRAYSGINQSNLKILIAKLGTISNAFAVQNYAVQKPDFENEVIKRFTETINIFLKAADNRIQYVYDFLLDMELAVNEYCQHMNCQPVTTCNFASYRYERILVLGTTVNNNIYTDTYRYHFVEAPSVQEDNQYKITAYKLYKRLWNLIEAHIDWMNTEGTTGPEVRIAVNPSRSAPSLLGSRAIPYYYNSIKQDESGVNVSNFLEYWSAHTCGNRSMLDIYSYNNYGADKQIPETHALDYNINEYNFFRIEGHIGHDVNEAEKTVNELINSKNLPFRTFRLMIKRAIVKSPQTSPVPGTRLAASSLKLSKAAGINVTEARANIEADQVMQVPFENINMYMQDFIGIGPDGGTLVGGTSGSGTYTPDKFRLNVEPIRTNPKILTLQDIKVETQRRVVLKVVGTNLAGRPGNEVFAGEIYSLQVVYGRNYEIYNPNAVKTQLEATKTEAEALGKAASGAAEASGFTANFSRFIVQPPYTPYSFPPVTVTAAEGDSTEDIAGRLVMEIIKLMQSNFNVNPRPRDVIASAENRGDEIHITLNNPPNASYLYYISPSATAVDSDLTHYLSVEYIGGGTLLSPVEVTICFKRIDAETKEASKVRMLTGTSMVDFPRDINAYLQVPQVYVICAVNPLEIDTGGTVDGEYNIWPFDANGNLLFNIFKGAEHLGGVYRGGTFIFLTEVVEKGGTEVVVGDIALPWDLEFIKLSRAVALKFNRKYWKWGNAWETYPPVFIK